jgi:hypothetical protein
MSAGHSGSTLLNMLLNGHPEILGISEVSAINLFAKDKFQEKSTFNSSFWKNVRKSYFKKTGEKLEAIDIKLKNKPGLQVYENWLEKNLALIEVIGKQSKTKYLVDTSKEYKRLYWLAQSPLNIKVILLTKNGKGISYSYLRKYGYAIFGNTIRRMYLLLLWFILIKLRFRLPSIHVKYEDLATSPEFELKRICHFLDLKYEPTMLKYRQHDYHGILGNRMRMETNQKIFLDEQWKQKMPRKYQLLFDMYAGWINKLFGY